MTTEAGGIFTSMVERERRQDWRLLAKAIRLGWLSDDKRQVIQERAFALCLREADAGNSEAFVKLATLLEKQYQSDRKAEAVANAELAERQSLELRKAELLRRLAGQCTATPAGLTLDERKDALRQRLGVLRAAGD